MKHKKVHISFIFSLSILFNINRVMHSYQKMLGFIFSCFVILFAVMSSDCLYISDTNSVQTTNNQLFFVCRVDHRDFSSNTNLEAFSMLILQSRLAIVHMQYPQRNEEFHRFCREMWVCDFAYVLLFLC